MSIEKFLEGLMGPYGVVVFGMGLAIAFYLRILVPGTWWRAERAARIRAENRINRLVLTIGKVTGASEVFLDALRDSAAEPDTSERL